MIETEPQTSSLQHLLSDLAEITNYDEANAARKAPTEPAVTTVGADKFLIDYIVGEVERTVLITEAEAREFLTGSVAANAPYTYARVISWLRSLLAQRDAVAQNTCERG